MANAKSQDDEEIEEKSEAQEKIRKEYKGKL